MADYRYLLSDLLTFDITAELPFTSASYSHVLNAPGSFTGTLSLQQTPQLSAILSENLAMGRSTILVERDGVIVWGGILWTDDTNFGDNTYTVNGQGWHSYFRRRYLTASKTYTGIEQVDIAADLIDWAQSQVGGSINVDTTLVTPTGVARDRTYLGIDRKNIGEAVEEIAAVIGGFDFRYDTVREGDVTSIEFRTNYPNSGRVTDLVFTLGSQIDSLNVSTDATWLATNVDAVGAVPEDQATPLLASASDVSRLSLMPRLDAVVSNTDVSEPATLQGYADLRLMRGSQPIVLPAMEVNPGLEPRIGTYNAGDLVTVQATSGFRSVDGLYRITEYGIAVDALGGEQATVAFATAEVFDE